MKKVLILTMSNGDAYNMAGRAIVNTIANKYPSVLFRMIDVAKGNTGINFQLSDDDTMSQKLAHKLECKRYTRIKETKSLDGARKVADVYLKKIKKYIAYSINNYNPTVIIATHAFPAIILSDLKKEGMEDVLNAKLAYVECDYVVSPYIKLANNLDYYFAPTAESVRAYKRFGVKSPSQVHSFGIPILSQIENVTDKNEAKEILNIPNDKYVILVTNGEHQSDHTLGLVKNIVNKYNDVYVIVTCNKNVKLKERLTKYVKNKKLNNVKIIGHNNNAGIILTACDVVMGKPIGMEVAQAISKGVPYISTLKSRGQELDNLKVLKKMGVIVNGRTIITAMNALDKIKNNGKYRQKVIDEGKKIYNYNATSEIVKFIYNNQRVVRELGTEPQTKKTTKSKNS